MNNFTFLVISSSFSDSIFHNPGQLFYNFGPVPPCPLFFSPLDPSECLSFAELAPGLAWKNYGIPQTEQWLKTGHVDD